MIRRKDPLGKEKPDAAARSLRPLFFSVILKNVKKLEGLSASRGIVVGPVFCLPEEAPVSVPRYAVIEAELGSHWARFEHALSRSRDEINLLKDDRSREQTEILDAHLMMLSDPEFIPQIRSRLFDSKLNIESILKDKVDEAVLTLRSTGDAYLSERAVDIEDAFGRVMGHLIRGHGVSGRFIPPGVILTARNIMPSEAFGLKDSGIIGIALEEGGATSHVAILARTWQIPAVMGVRGLLEGVRDGDEIVLDAENGMVICEPTVDQVQTYRLRSRESVRSREEQDIARRKLLKVRSETRDKVALSLRANIAMAEEAAAAREEGADGIGLYRSEFLYLLSDHIPDEETQLAAYRSAIEAMAGAPVIIRTLDAGADKMLDEQKDLGEKNPLLGWRAVRYCLDRREMFKTQLRALLRASVFGNLGIMFPMISGVEEFDAVLEVLEESKAECLARSQAFSRNLKVGVMIEIPSAALCAEALARKADFMSIGTNDLIQYTLAVDRENPRVSHLFDGFHPAVLQLIKRTIDAGKAGQSEVSICGEMGGDPAAVLLLLGMGLRNFSMSPALLSPVKELLRKVTVAEAADLASLALTVTTAREIRKLVQEKIKTYE